MAEIKRGYKIGDHDTVTEAQMLEGVSWSSWKPVLANHLKDRGLSMPSGTKETILHDWFVLRSLRKLRKISPAKYSDQKDEIFKRELGIFGDPSMAFSITFINNKTEIVKS